MATSTATLPLERKRDRDDANRHGLPGLIPGIALLAVVGYAGKMIEQGIARYGKAHHLVLPTSSTSSGPSSSASSSPTPSASPASSAPESPPTSSGSRQASSSSEPASSSATSSTSAASPSPSSPSNSSSPSPS